MSDADASLVIKALERLEIVGHGVVFVVESPVEMSRDRPEIMGQTVLIEWGGQTSRYQVRDVERFMPATPIYPGEKIGLFVDLV